MIWWWGESNQREYDGESRFDGEGRMMVGHWSRNDKVDDSCICDKRVRSTLAHACRRRGRCPGGRKKGWHWIKIKRSYESMVVALMLGYDDVVG
jgi:hypothetical protein